MQYNGSNGSADEVWPVLLHLAERRLYFKYWHILNSINGEIVPPNLRYPSDVDAQNVTAAMNKPCTRIGRSSPFANTELSG